MRSFRTAWSFSHSEPSEIMREGAGGREGGMEGVIAAMIQHPSLIHLPHSRHTHPLTGPLLHNDLPEAEVDLRVALKEGQKQLEGLQGKEFRHLPDKL